MTKPFWFKNREWQRCGTRLTLSSSEVAATSKGRLPSFSSVAVITKAWTLEVSGSCSWLKARYPSGNPFFLHFLNYLFWNSRLERILSFHISYLSRLERYIPGSKILVAYLGENSLGRNFLPHQHWCEKEGAVVQHMDESSSNIKRHKTNLLQYYINLSSITSILSCNRLWLFLIGCYLKMAVTVPRIGAEQDLMQRWRKTETEGISMQISFIWLFYFWLHVIVL